MIRSLRKSSGALAENKAQPLSFACSIFSHSSQYAYWLNKISLCCNWCIDTLGNDLWNMVFKLWSYALCLICNFYSCLIFVTCSVCYPFLVLQLPLFVHVMSLNSCFLGLCHMPTLFCRMPNSWWIKCIWLPVLWLCYG